MEIKDFSQAMALQKELSAKLVTNIDKLRKEKAASVADTVKEQERLIAQAKTELATSEKEKALAIKRWDQKVQQRQATVTRLEAGLKEMKKKVTEQEKASKKTAPTKKVIATRKKLAVKKRGATKAKTKTTVSRKKG